MSIKQGILWYINLKALDESKCKEKIILKVDVFYFRKKLFFQRFSKNPAAGYSFNKNINKNIMIIEYQVVYYARDINFLISNTHINLAKEISSSLLSIPTKSQRLKSKINPSPDVLLTALLFKK